jgi:hypothetical protein
MTKHPKVCPPGFEHLFFGPIKHLQVDEITHRLGPDECYQQIVSPQRLREILDADGDDYEKPSWMTHPDDEWEVAND